MSRGGQGERGAALLLAMLLAALLATSAAGSLWKQRAEADVEAAEHERAQAQWILNGALDWARFQLREDARTGAAGPARDAWDIPFDDARVSGQVVDLQSRLNVAHLAALGRISEPALRSFTRLFDVLGLPEAELARLAENLRRASDIGPDSALAGAAPAAPQRLEDLAGLGLRRATIAALEPHATVLPTRSAVNLNTASAQVLYSAIDGIGMQDARRLVAARAAAPFQSAADAARLLPAGSSLPASDFCVASRLFEVRGRVEVRGTVRDERTIVQRDGQEVVVLQRGPAAGAGPRAD